MKITRIGWMLAALLLMMVGLAGCTRERSTPVIPTDTPLASNEPAVQVAPSTPTPAPPTPSPTPDVTPTPAFILYTVKEGDTLSDIAVRFDTDVETLREVNLLQTDSLIVGYVLRIPYKDGMTPEGMPTPTPTPYIYTVQEGDTLGSIALRFGVSPQVIQDANQLTDPNQLIPGHRLLIPGAQLPNQGGTEVGTTEASAAAEIPSEPTPEPFRYVVQPGDTLSSIAVRFDVDMQTLMAANNITDPNTLRVGQELVIPGYQPPEATSPPGSVIHVVQPGETLYSIAQRYGVDPDAIIQANNLSDPNLLRTGQELVIPGATESNATGQEPRIHVVQPGETLYSIARQYGVDPDAIIQANNLSDPDILRTGQELVIP